MKLKTLIHLAAILLTFCSLNAKGQLFTTISDADANLTSEELAKLDLLRNEPVYESITMVEVGDVLDLQEDGLLIVNLPGHPTMKAQLGRLNVSDPLSPSNGFEWEGAFMDSVITDTSSELVYDGSIELFKKNGEVYGFIYPYNSLDVYELASLAPGKNALIKFNHEALTESENCSAIANTDETEVMTTSGPCNTTIKVLVLYTTSAKNSVFNINNPINQAISDLNGARFNSGLMNTDIDFVLVEKREVPSFYETYNDMYSTLLDFRANSWVQHWRNFYQADIVVGIVSTSFSEEWGKSFLGLSSTDPFAVVNVHKMNVGYAFSHEAGHTVGCYHQTENVWSEDDHDMYPGQAHGYGFTRRPFPLGNGVRYNDVMHQRMPFFNAGGQYAHMFSTPNKKIWNKNMGVAGTNDNTQHLKDVACTVAEFKQDNFIEFKASLTANPANAITGQTINLTVTPKFGVAPYLYVWYRSTDGGKNFNYITTTSSSGSSSITQTMQNASTNIFYVKATTYGGIEEEHLTKVIWNNLYPAYSSPSTPLANKSSGSDEQVEQTEQAAFAMHQGVQFQIYPNPANSSESVTVETGLSVDEANKSAELTIADIYGRTLLTESLNGRTVVNLNTANLPAGIYFVTLSTKAHSTTEKLLIIK